MAEVERKFFNVKNISLRLVGFGVLSVPPEKVFKVFDDPEGINRATIEKDLFLDFTDDEADFGDEFGHDITVKISNESAPVVKTTETKKVAGKAAAATKTGAGWTK